LALGRHQQLSASIIQNVKTGPRRDPCGYDASKKIKGRKCMPLVDTEGLVHAIQLMLASVQDRATPAVIEPEIKAGALLKIWADLAFNGDDATAPMFPGAIDLELVGGQSKIGFAGKPRRWRIEQTFGILSR
jgi:hypothetical protein